MDAKIEKILVEIEKMPGGPFWNVPRTTGLFLNMMARVMKAGKILEIGTSNGYSGIFLAEGLLTVNGALYTIESNEQRFELARQSFEKAGLAKFVRQIFGHAPEVFYGKNFVKGAVMKSSTDGGDAGPMRLTSLQGVRDFELIFVDATKGEYQSYLDAILPLLADGGVIIADNVLSHADEVQAYVQAVNSDSRLESLLLPFDNGLMVSWKK